jgi:hypothetical protein
MPLRLIFLTFCLATVKSRYKAEMPQSNATLIAARRPWQPTFPRSRSRGRATGRTMTRPSRLREKEGQSRADDWIVGACQPYVNEGGHPARRSS